MLKWLLTFILDYVVGKLSEWVTKIVAKFKRQEEIQKEAEKSVEDLEKAKTAEEIDRAATDTLNGL